MINLETFKELFDKNGVNYHITPLYDEDNNQGYAIWLDKGHLEFDFEEILTNVVNWG